MSMKKITFITLLFALVLGGCNYLEDYSQSQTLVKSVADLDEVLLGEVYMPSKSGVKHLYQGDLGWWLQVLDDDINTVSWNKETSTLEAGAIVDDYAYLPMDNNIYGYTTWQREVGRSYDETLSNADDALWTSFYRRINICNIILSEIEKLDPPTDEEVAAALRVRGEAHAMRAYYYFYLVNIYADAYKPGTAETTLGVPLKLTEYVEHDKEKDTQFDRAPISDIYAQIVEDLNIALSYLEQSPQPSSYYRISEKAARLLLSRVYLYMQDWDNARIEAGKVLEDNDISLWSYGGDLKVGESLISRDNPEILFSQGSLNVQNYMRAKVGDFCISQDLYSLYDDDDYRKTKFFEINKNTDSVALSSKFQRGTTILSYVSDLYLLRSSEAYLNMAEACAECGGEYETEALRYLNEFCRYRYRNYNAKTYTGDELINQIRTERRKEFCVEGQRWFDLRRYAVNDFHPYKRTIDRVYSVHNVGGTVLRNETYRLEIDDPNYTFSIPKTVQEFDKVPMPDNMRVDKSPINITIPVIVPDEDEDEEGEGEGGNENEDNPEPEEGV